MWIRIQQLNYMGIQIIKNKITVEITFMIEFLMEKLPNYVFQGKRKTHQNQNFNHGL